MGHFRNYSDVIYPQVVHRFEPREWWSTRVPYDEVAEEEVIGVVIGSPYGAGLIVGRGLVVDDFYKPTHARLFAVIDELKGIDTDDDRAERASELAAVPRTEVNELVHRRCVAWDESGCFSRRVQAAARLRAAMTAFADAFNALGAGAELDEVRPFVEAVL